MKLQILARQERRTILTTFTIMLIIAASAVRLAAQSYPESLNFNPPGTRYQNRMGTAPAITSYNGQMFIAFKANDSSNTLWFTSSTDGGVTYAYPGYNDRSITLGSAPALAVYNNLMFLVFLAGDGSGNIEYTTTSDGINFTPVVNTGYYSKGTPAIAVYNNVLNIVYRGPDNSLAYTSLWYGQFGYGNPPSLHFGYSFQNIVLGGNPGMAVFNGLAYVAYQSNDGTNTLNITTEPTNNNGSPEFSAPVSYPGIRMGSAPAAVAFSDALYLAFKSNDGFNRLWVVGSLDGVNFTNPGTDYTGSTMNGGTGPALAVYNNEGLNNFDTNGDLYLALLSNDGFHQLWTLYATPIFGQ